MSHGQQTFGELMTEYFLKTGWSRAEVARRTGFSSTYIGNLLQDRAPATKSGKPVRLSAKTVDKIAGVLKIPLEQARRAAGLASPPSNQPQVAGESLPPVAAGVEEMLLYYFRALPAERRPDALAIMARLYQDSLRLAAREEIDEAEIGQPLEIIGRIGQG